jgi:hypothetical protein
MASIAATHKSWAKLIVDTLEQQETNEQHVGHLVGRIEGGQQFGNDTFIQFQNRLVARL